MPSPTLTAAQSPLPGSAPSTPPSNSQPWIRFSPYTDPRSLRPSLTFTPVCRILPTGSDVIRVGRYSDREAQIAPGSSPGVTERMPSAAPVGFKSKVVSRRHCEFWSSGGRWFVRDVKSSSGTFLNHIRLSSPGTESRPFPINDGDIVQLGIDFKGGEEMIFRCVKMRMELNRAWQSKPNNFNLATHRRLRSLATAGAGSSSQDCSICLNSIAPCQSLFVAPCSHTWHFKCIRSLLAIPHYPTFQCPNCRAGADLEADVEDVEEWQKLEWYDDDLKDGKSGAQNPAEPVSPTILVAHETPATPATLSGLIPPAAPPLSVIDVVVSPSTIPALSRSQSPVSPPSVAAADEPAGPIAVTRTSQGSEPQIVAPLVERHSTLNRPAYPQPMPIRSAPRDRNRLTPSPTASRYAVIVNEGPLTPRNDAGPWVFDGGAGQRR